MPKIVQRNDRIETRRRIAAINEEAVARRVTVVVTGQEEEEDSGDVHDVQRHLQSLGILHQDLLGPFQHHIIVIITTPTRVTVGHSIMHTTHHHLDC